jgi:anti-sigma factor RsiW
MNDMTCHFAGDRDETLIAYLYRDVDPADRIEFESHLTTCATCRRELEALGGVRAELARWAPPEPIFAIANPEPRAARHQPRTTSQPRVTGPTPPFGRGPWWRGIPAWAQVAAALLVLGVSAGIANLDVRYDRGGLTVRTGWWRPAAASSTGQAAPATAAWRNDLAALEQQLRGELRASQAAAAATTTSTPPAPRAASAVEPELLRRVKALIDESERRQQTELALRVAQVERDVFSQRQADLRKIDQNLGRMQDQTGVEVLKQRQMLNLLVQRVSQRQ